MTSQYIITMSSTPEMQQQKLQFDKEHQEVYQNCILGSHILHFHGILDAYGHLSFRHPTKPGIFIMPRNVAPANITSLRDLVEYNVADASAVNSSAAPGYIERFIHSEVYKKYSAVNSVIHSHAAEVVPYSISEVPMKPCLHMAGFLGDSTPVYDIAKHYQPGDIRDLLIRNSLLGESLALCFHQPADNLYNHPDEPDHPVVLMRGHGYTATAHSIEECVFRAIYTKVNAAIQTACLGLRAAYHGKSAENFDIQYLHAEEITGTTAMARSAWGRAWALWVHEVEAARLYVNER